MAPQGYQPQDRNRTSRKAGAKDSDRYKVFNLRGNRVIPFPVKLIADQRECVHLFLGRLWDIPRRRVARTRPVAVRTFPMRSTMVSYVVSGVPRQFAVM